MSIPRERVGLPTAITVVPWRDPVGEATGHRPGSAYVEAVWLPVLGPSATWAWQRLARIATVHSPVRLEVAELAAGIGLGGRLGASSTMARTLERLERFGALRRSGDVFAVRVALPDLSESRVARLGASARLAHRNLAAGPGNVPAPEMDTHRPELVP